MIIALSIPKLNPYDLSQLGSGPVEPLCSFSFIVPVIGENIELRTQLSPALGSVRMDPTQLNLVLNARDAMPGDGRIQVLTENCDFHVAPGTLPAGPLPGIRLSVIDTGCGVGEETRSHLFEPFFTTKSAGPGNGLALATVHEIVQNAGGIMEVESELGQGTTFSVILPRISEASKSEFPEFQYSPRAARETILLLEDSLTVRQAARGLLREYGYCVLEASTGSEALSLADHDDGPIDLLVADLAIPGIGGRTVARRLRTTRPGLKCLYISGYEPHMRRGQADVGPGIFFQKPFTGAVLLQKVREILEERPPA